MEEDLHKKWLTDNGLGEWANKPRPEFLSHCSYDDNNPDNCSTCVYKKECDAHFEPLAKAFEKFYEIGEV